MRGFVVAVLALAAGCGFTTGGGHGSPSDDASVIDAPPSGDANSDATVDQMLDAPIGPQCPATYAPILSVTGLGSRYRFVTTSAQWITAENDCADDAAGGELATHLIVLDDVAEKTAMIGGLAGGLNINDQWVGATDLASEGQLAYVTDQLTTLSLTPSMQADNHDCVRIKNSGNEEYRDCTETNKYVCECDGRTADPSRFPNLPNGNP